MKKLLFAIALICFTSFAANAQYNSLRIVNNTPCTVYVTIYGTWTGNVPPCATDFYSSIISIPATTTVNYANPTSVPGGLNNGGVPLSSAKCLPWLGYIMETLILLAYPLVHQT